MGMTVDVTSYQDAFAYFDKVTWLNCNNPTPLVFHSRNQVEIFQPNCWDNYSDLLERIPVTPRSRWEERSFEIISTTNFLIFLVSGDVCLRLRWLSVPHSADNELFCRSVQCVFFGPRQELKESQSPPVLLKFVWIFIFLSQGLSGLSQVSSGSLIQITSQDRQSLKYFVLFYRI